MKQKTLFLKWKRSSMLNVNVFQISRIFCFMTWKALQIILMHDQNQLEVINWEKVDLALCSKATSMAKTWLSRSSLLWVVLGIFHFNYCVFYIIDLFILFIVKSVEWYISRSVVTMLHISWIKKLILSPISVVSQHSHRS